MRTFYSLRKKFGLRELLGAGLILGVLFYVYMVSPPFNFPENSVVRVEEGDTLGTIAVALERLNVIQSDTFFSIIVRVLARDTDVQAGQYFFPQKESAFTVARRLVDGDYGITPVVVRVPEGYSNVEIAELMEEKLPEFDAAEFLEDAATLEGMLFPDTYYLLPTAESDDVIKRLHDTFTEKTEDLRILADEKGIDFHEAVIVASLVEREVRVVSDRRRVAGIIWKRLEDGMPLQIDAVFVYLLGKGSRELTRDDLDIDSPYNTYRYAGLPPGAISNPSLNALESTLNFENTPYWFYLSDRAGNTYYAATFDEHISNRRKYLD